MSKATIGESLAASALLYAVELGWSVFPLTPRDKHPLPGSHGVHDATSDPERIGAWWDAHPDANIGLACGAASGVFVLDVDSSEGEQALAALGANVLRTVEQRTMKGRHRFFRMPAVSVHNSASRLGPKLDVRGDGGYVVLAPSMHPEGRRYTWTTDPLTAPIAAAPVPVLEALARCAMPEPPPTSTRVLPPGGDDRLARAQRYLAKVTDAPEGARNGTCYIVAAALVRDFALGEADAWSMLAEFNAAHCFPPLGARELRMCLRSAIRHGKRSVGSAFLDDRSRDPFAGRRTVGVSL